MTDSPKQRIISWIKEAERKVEGKWNAMCISTVCSNGRPASRLVLFKQFSANDNIIFFTNYNSTKSTHLLENGFISVNFHWEKLGRQLRIQGRASKTTEEVSRTYFNSRSFESRVAAIVSDQSQKVEKYEDLVKAYENSLQTMSGQEAGCPEHWGGFEIVPDRVEFWEEHPDRLHKRSVHQKTSNGWERFFLAP
jgi:pyridoxamine 5'-phosphate oxidase